MKTLQERLRKMTMPVSEQAYPVCLEAATTLDTLEAEVARLKEEKNKAEWILENSGFRRCDIDACNCGSWHQVGGFKARFDEIKEVVEEAGYSTNGRVLLEAVKQMAKDATATPLSAQKEDVGDFEERLKELFTAAVLSPTANTIGDLRILTDKIVALHKSSSDRERGLEEAAVIAWIESWVSNPANSYSTDALEGLFAMTLDRIRSLKRSQEKG